MIPFLQKSTHNPTRENFGVFSLGQTELIINMEYLDLDLVVI